MEVSFYNYSVRPSIWVENMTNERLVAFRGSVTPGTLISGIPAFSGQHGLRRDTNLFTTNAAFPLLLVTEADFDAHRNNLGAAPVFARVFVFYNATATNNNVFQISSMVGGEGRLTVSNPHAFDVELRDGGPTGEILGFAAARMTSGNVLRIHAHAPAALQVFPVFVFFNQIEQEIFRVTPRFRGGRFDNRPYMRRFYFDGAQLNHHFDLGDIEGEGAFGLSSGAAYLRIDNQTNTMLQLMRGSEMLITSLGIPAINSGQHENFTLNFGRNPDGTFADTHNVGTLSIGLGEYFLDIPRHVFNLDYQYTLVVRGTITDLQLEAIVRGERVDLERMFGLD